MEYSFRSIKKKIFLTLVFICSISCESIIEVSTKIDHKTGKRYFEIPEDIKKSKVDFIIVTDETRDKETKRRIGEVWSVRLRFCGTIPIKFYYGETFTNIGCKKIPVTQNSDLTLVEYEAYKLAEKGHKAFWEPIKAKPLKKGHRYILHIQSESIIHSPYLHFVH